MSHDVTNFLPPDKRQAFKRGYFLRLGILALFLIAFLVLAHGVLLIPSYLYAKDLKAQAQTQLSARSLAALEEGEEGISARLERLETQAETLATFFRSPTATERFNQVLDVPSAGITLTTLSIDMTGEGEGRMRIVGRASSREVLREYYLALSSLSFIAQADLPLSAYAKETDIDFAIDVTIKALP